MTIKSRDIFLPLGIVFIAILIPLVPHAPNFVPIGALALFGGANLPKKYAFTVPFAVMFLSDLFLGFHLTMIFVYLSFFITIIIGLFIKNRKNVRNVILGSFASSIIFFVITNFGVWVLYDFYPKNLSGLFESYILAIPFFHNTLLSDLIYNAVFFGGYVFVRQFILEKKMSIKNT